MLGADKKKKKNEKHLERMQNGQNGVANRNANVNDDGPARANENENEEVFHEANENENDVTANENNKAGEENENENDDNKIENDDDDDEPEKADKDDVKMLKTMLKEAAAEFAKVVEVPTSEVEREKAFHGFVGHIEVFLRSGGSVVSLTLLVRMSLVKSTRGQATLAKAHEDGVWKGVRDATAFAAGLRRALNWPALTWGRAVDLVPFVAGKSIAPRVTALAVLTKGVLIEMSEVQREVQIYSLVREMLRSTAFKVRLPAVPAAWSEVTSATFVREMRAVSNAYDEDIESPARAAKVEASTVAVAVPAVQYAFSCHTCGKPGHLAGDCSQPKRCFACNQLGHIRRDCPSPIQGGRGGRGARGGRGFGRGGWRGGRGGNVVATAMMSEKPVATSIFDYPYLFTQRSYVVLMLDAEMRATQDLVPLMVQVEVQGAESAPSVQCELLVDTGAVPSVISKAFAARAGAAIRPSRTTFIRGVGNTRTEIVGEATVGVMLGGRTFGVSALVAETTVFDFLLGTRGMRAQGVVPVQIELDEGGGRVRMAGSAWVRAVGWVQPEDPRAANVLVLRDDSTAWRTAPTSVFMIVPEVGVLQAQFELAENEGLTVGDVIDVMGFSTEPPVALTTGQESHVAEALRAMAEAERSGRDGAPWTLPSLTSEAPIVPPGPMLQGSDVEAYTSVLIGPDLGPDVTARIKALCKEYRDILGGSKGEGATLAPPMNKTKRAIKLVLYPNADLEDVVARFRRTSPDDAKLLEEFALKMEKEGRLRRETNAPASSLALVVKKDDGSRRVVVNFGPLNQQLLSNHFPLPRIDDTLDFLAKGAFRSSYDLWLCFHQFGISPESIPLTATWFSPSLLMSWMVAPMGIKVIPAAVQSVMSTEFNNAYTVVYIDDVMQVMAKAEEVVEATKHVFEICRQSGWTLNARKCKIGFGELAMLGKIVGPGTIKVKPEHLDGIKNYGVPTTYRQLRAFNGMLTALTKHLPSAASTIRVLYEAAGGGKQGHVEWTDEMRAAFEAALALLSSSEVVVPFDESRPLLLLTDWSVEGGAGVFAHLAHDESHFEIIDTFSHANSGAESNYAAAEGEIAMVRLALKQFPHLICFAWAQGALGYRCVDDEDCV